MSNEIFYIDPGKKVRSAYGDFYEELKNKKIIDYYYQLFPMAFLIGIKDGNKDSTSKQDDLFDVKFIKDYDMNIIKGIALLKLDYLTDGNHLFNEMIAFADKGIQIIKEDYENDGVIRLDKYI